MISERIFGCVVLGILAIVTARSAIAGESGFYADLDIGQARYPYSALVNLHGVTLRSVDAPIKDTSWGATAGYRFTPYFGSEVGYVNLGKASIPVANASEPGATQGEARFTSKGATAALVGAVQVGNLEAFLRVGYLFSHADLSVAAVDGSTKLNTTVSANRLTPFGGLGFRYAFDDFWHVKIEFDRYDDVGDAARTGAANINVATLGVGCRF